MNRMFDRMSRSELSLYIGKYGLSALPRLTNHDQRVREAMQFQQTDDPVAAFQKVYDAAHQCPSKGPPRAVEQYPCANCGEPFHPTKGQINRGNGLFCPKPGCRTAARIVVLRGPTKSPIVAVASPRIGCDKARGSRKEVAA